MIAWADYRSLFIVFYYTLLYTFLFWYVIKSMNFVMLFVGYQVLVSENNYTILRKSYKHKKEQGFCGNMYKNQIFYCFNEVI